MRVDSAWDDRRVNRQRVVTFVFVLIAAAALAIRVPRLELRPMHADEAVQAARFRDLWQEGRYRYDPHEFHGPTLIYATYPSMLLSRMDRFDQTSAATYRIVPVLFGAGSILLLWLLRDALGRVGSFWGAVFMACSPACVFYSRYYIHETLLVCFTLGALTCGWRYARSGRWAWCAAAGAAVGLMQATKETAVLSYAAAAVALLVAAWSAGPALLRKPLSPRRWSWVHLAVGAISALLVALLLYSSFGTHARGPWDGILTYVIWLRRAGGESVHIHPWHFYLQRLLWWRDSNGWLWSEAFIVALASIGVLSACLARWRLPPEVDRGFVRFLSVYTLLVTVIYAAIPYKTPWCLLQFWLGAMLLAGVGVSALWCASRGRLLRAILCVLLAAGTGHLIVQAYCA
ncbi:MAG: TIGR03663 family protein, partial [Pirellulaceae bacterium]|nr:TIGR03663 family protein [Pirellulaceae bacterium]